MSETQSSPYASYEWGRAGYSDGTGWGEIGYSDYQLAKSRNELTSSSSGSNADSNGIWPLLLCAGAAYMWYTGARAFYLHYLVATYYVSFPAGDLALMILAFAAVQVVCIWCMVTVLGWAWSIIAVPALLPPLYPTAIFASGIAAKHWSHFGGFRDYVGAELYAGRFPPHLDRWISHQLDDSGLALMQASIPGAMAGYALLVPLLVLIALLVRWVRSVM